MPSRTKPKEEPNDSAEQQAAAAVADATPDEPTIEEYEKHRAEVLARLPEEKDRPQNIYARLAQINGFIGLIRKTGVNRFHNYNYAKEADLVEEIRPMLSAYGIWLEQGLYGDPEKGIVAHQRLPQTSKEGSSRDTLTAITKRFRFVWWNETTKQLHFTEWESFMGYGDDAGDKGYYKAETGAVKYFLMKTFMVATGDDPEGDTRADQRAAGRDAVDVQVRRAPQGAAAHGGRQQQASAPQTRQIGELLRALGIVQSIDAIKKIEEITKELMKPTSPDEDPADTLKAYLAGLSGPKAGAIVTALRAETKPKGEADAPAEPDVDAQPAPAAAAWQDDQVSSSDGGDDGADGSIPSAIE